MKKALCASFAILASLAAFAQEGLASSGFEPVLADSSSGASIATATGAPAFFGNPAAFDLDSGLFFFGGAWAYFQAASSASFLATLSGGGDASTIVAMVDDGGFGYGSVAGVAVANKGLGLAVVFVSDAYVDGDTGAGYHDESLQLVIGYSDSFDFFGGTLSIGGDLRSFYRVKGDLDSVSLASIATGAYLDDPAFLARPALAGFGLAFDVGAIWLSGGLSLGLVVRDIVAPFSYGSFTNGELISALSSFHFPGGSGASSPAVEYPLVGVGASYRLFPDGEFDLGFDLALVDAIGAIQGPEAFLASLRFGASLAVFDSFEVSCGLRWGWYSFGIGADFGPVAFNAAFFASYEIGVVSGDPDSGASLELALKL
jgi:hypothetical protein